MPRFERFLGNSKKQPVNPAEVSPMASSSGQVSVEHDSRDYVKTELGQVLRYDRVRQQYKDYEKMITILRELAEIVGTDPLQPKTINVADLKRRIGDVVVAIENLSLYRGKAQRTPLRDSLVDTLRQGELGNFIEKVVSRKTALGEQLQTEATAVAAIETKYPIEVERMRFMAGQGVLSEEVIIETATQMKPMPNIGSEEE